MTITKTVKSRRLTPLEKRRAARAAAMPAVKALVRKYGRSNVAHCIGQLKDHEKTVERLNNLKKEVARLERTI